MVKASFTSLPDPIGRKRLAKQAGSCIVTPGCTHPLEHTICGCKSSNERTPVAAAGDRQQAQRDLPAATGISLVLIHGATDCVQSQQSKGNFIAVSGLAAGAGPWIQNFPQVYSLMSIAVWVNDLHALRGVSSSSMIGFPTINESLAVQRGTSTHGDCR
jgi:hypothetical protein